MWPTPTRAVPPRGGARAGARPPFGCAMRVDAMLLQTGLVHRCSWGVDCGQLARRHTVQDMGFCLPCRH